MKNRDGMASKTYARLIVLLIVGLPFLLFLTFFFTDIVRSRPPAKPLPTSFATTNTVAPAK
jgi:hypothetical protein